MTCQFCNSPLKIGEDEVFTCGSFTWKSEWRRTNECQLGEKILNLTKELSESNEYARRLNLKITDLCKERDEWKAKLEKLEGLFSYAVNGASDAFDEAGIRAGEFVDRAVIAKQRIKFLESWIEDLSFWGWNPSTEKMGTVNVLLDPQEFVYLGNRKPEGLK